MSLKCLLYRCVVVGRTGRCAVNESFGVLLHFVERSQNTGRQLTQTAQTLCERNHRKRKLNTDSFNVQDQSSVLVRSALLALPCDLLGSCIFHLSNEQLLLRCCFARTDLTSPFCWHKGFTRNLCNVVCAVALASNQLVSALEFSSWSCHGGPHRATDVDAQP